MLCLIGDKLFVEMKQKTSLTGFPSETVLLLFFFFLTVLLLTMFPVKIKCVTSFLASGSGFMAGFD